MRQPRNYAEYADALTDDERDELTLDTLHQWEESGAISHANARHFRDYLTTLDD